MTAGQVSHGVQGQPGWIDEALREHAQTSSEHEQAGTSSEHEQAEHEQPEPPRTPRTRRAGASCRWPTGSSRSWTASTAPGAAARGSGKNASRCRTARAARRPRP